MSYFTMFQIGEKYFNDNNINVQCLSEVKKLTQTHSVNE